MLSKKEKFQYIFTIKDKKIKDKRSKIKDKRSKIIEKYGSSLFKTQITTKEKKIDAKCQ